jgi:hypothetical protein
MIANCTVQKKSTNLKIRVVNGAHILETYIASYRQQLLQPTAGVAPLYPYIRTRTCACGSRPSSKFRVLQLFL